MTSRQKVISFYRKEKMFSLRIFLLTMLTMFIISPIAAQPQMVWKRVVCMATEDFQKEFPDTGKYMKFFSIDALSNSETKQQSKLEMYTEIDSTTKEVYLIETVLSENKEISCILFIGQIGKKRKIEK